MSAWQVLFKEVHEKERSIACFSGKTERGETALTLLTRYAWYGFAVAIAFVLAAVMLISSTPRTADAAEMTLILGPAPPSQVSSQIASPIPVGGLVSIHDAAVLSVPAPNEILGSIGSSPSSAAAALIDDKVALTEFAAGLLVTIAFALFTHRSATSTFAAMTSLALVKRTSFAPLLM